MKIPFNKPTLMGSEHEYIQNALDNWYISGDGPFTHKCSSFLERHLGVAKSLLTTSCTHALEMAAILLDIKTGDEVILPSYTFVSTANAFVLRGAKPIFIDIRNDTLNLDESLLESLITKNTKAIVPVHYAGVGCEMDKLMEVANHYGIPVVEDNAHGLFGKYKGKNLGTFGALATQSFHETKNISCGEGGSLLINDEKYVERAEIIREKGTDRSRFFRGQVDKYSWVDIGSSYLPSDILAAFLFAQLESSTHIQNKRKMIWDYYFMHLQNWAKSNDIGLPYIPDHCSQSYHMFYMLFPSYEKRSDFIKYLGNKNISAVFHYLPLHLSEMGKQLRSNVPNCPVTEDVSDTLVRLPFYNDLSNSELAYVVEAITAWS